MKLFYDLRLGYLVSAPGIDTPLEELQGKAGDGAEVIVQFGRSSDPTGSSSILTAPTWTPENLAGGTVITVCIKEDGEYSDGTALASNSTWTHDAVAFTYTGAFNLNTAAINTALERDNADAGDDIASLDCGFEITFQVGGSGPWRSSELPVPFTLYHDIISGSEGTPAEADDPTEYLLKASGIEWYPTVTSKTGGTSADLDYVPTVAVTVGKCIAFLDADGSPNIIRHYILTAGTDAESSPDVIRPDDYNGSTNAKVWKLRPFGYTSLTGGTGSTDNAILRADGTGGTAVQSSGITIADGATGTLSGTNSGDATLGASVSGVLTLTGQVLSSGTGAPGADRIIFWDQSATAWAYLTAGTGLSISGTTITASVSPVPSSVVVYSATGNIAAADSGKLLAVDTSAGSVILTINSSTTGHFWVRYTGANSCDIAGSGVTLDVNGSSGLILTASVTYHFYEKASDDWILLSQSA